MLKIALDRIIPEHKKPRKIEVKEPQEKSERQFLAVDAVDQSK